jgi:predicted restriction endonuclease
LKPKKNVVDLRAIIFCNSILIPKIQLIRRQRVHTSKVCIRSEKKELLFVCGITILTKSGRYAEGAHIRPLGKPHDGDDNSDNLICLCPNHHVMFDKGTFSILDNFNLIGNEKHKLNKSNLEYHRKSHGI